MSKTAITTIIVTVVIFIAGIFILSRGSKNKEPLASPTTYEFFWGNGCPHCVNVENFLSSWDKKDKIQITKYEVWNNKENAVRMEERALSCGIDLKQMGVPLLYTLDGKCFDGDGPIIDYFKSLQL